MSAKSTTQLSDQSPTANAASLVAQTMSMFEAMSALTRDNIAAMTAASRIASEHMKGIAEVMAEHNRTAMSETTAASRALTAIQNPQDLMKFQTEFAQGRYDAAVAEMNAISDRMSAMGKEMAETLQTQARDVIDRTHTALATPKR